MTVLTLFILILGACGITEWIRHDHRLNDLLIRLESNPTRHTQFLCEVLKCGFCLSHWVGILTLLLWFVIPLGKYLVLLFAVIRGANLTNDLTKIYNQSPERPDFGDSIDEPN